MKELRLIITFHTTTEAMAFETACRNHAMAGRLIPVPREVSAGCGLSWCTDTGSRTVFREFIEKYGLSVQEMAEVFF